MNGRTVSKNFRKRGKTTTTSLTHVVYHGAAIPRLSMTACVTIVNPDLCISGRVNAPKNTTS